MGVPTRRLQRRRQPSKAPAVVLSSVLLLGSPVLGCSETEERDNRFDEAGSGPVGGAGGSGSGTGGATTGGGGSGGGSAAALRYDQVRQKSSHNAYERHEALIDQLVYHRIRSVELDLHVTKSGWPAVGGDWYVYHDSNNGETRCHRLSDCLDELAGFREAVPQHEVVTVFLDLKDDFQGAGHGPADLDALLASKLGAAALVSPQALMAACPAAASLRDAVAGSCRWPRLTDLRGRFVFALTGGAACSPTDKLNVYVDQGTTAGARTAFIAPDLNDSCAWSTYEQLKPYVVLFNLESAAASQATTVYQAGLMSRVWDLNTSGAWGAAFNARAHFLATDKVNYHQDSWAVTHLPNGWPFRCFGPCVPEPVEPAHLIGIEVDSGDIWDQADGMFFRHRPVAAAEATWSALVSTVNSHVEPFAKGCLMARASLDPASPYFAVCRPADEHPIRAQYRTVAGGSSSAVEVPLLPPDTVDQDSAAFVRLQLSGSTASPTARAYGSLDGQSWTLIHTQSFSEALPHQGLAASSHGNATPVKLLFGNVALSQDGGPATLLTTADLPAADLVGTCAAGQAFDGVFP